MTKGKPKVIFYSAFPHTKTTSFSSELVAEMLRTNKIEVIHAKKLLLDDGNLLIKRNTEGIRVVIPEDNCFIFLNKATRLEPILISKGIRGHQYAQAESFANNPILAKEVLRQAGVSVPKFVVSDQLKYPYIIKSGYSTLEKEPKYVADKKDFVSYHIEHSEYISEEAVLRDDLPQCSFRVVVCGNKAIGAYFKLSTDKDFFSSEKKKLLSIPIIQNTSIKNLLVPMYRQKDNGYGYKTFEEYYSKLGDKELELAKQTMETSEIEFDKNLVPMNFPKPAVEESIKATEALKLFMSVVDVTTIRGKAEVLDVNPVSSLSDYSSLFSCSDYIKYIASTLTSKGGIFDV